MNMPSVMPFPSAKLMCMSFLSQSLPMTLLSPRLLVVEARAHDANLAHLVAEGLVLTPERRDELEVGLLDSAEVARLDLLHVAAHSLGELPQERPLLLLRPHARAELVELGLLLDAHVLDLAQHVRQRALDERVQYRPEPLLETVDAAGAGVQARELLAEEPLAVLLDVVRATALLDVVAGPADDRMVAELELVVLALHSVEHAGAL